MADGTLKVGTITNSAGSGNITIGSGVTVNVNRPAFHAYLGANQTAADATDYKDYMRLVGEDNPNRLEADPMKMFPILVKAIQELSAKNTALEARITTLEG